MDEIKMNLQLFGDGGAAGGDGGAAAAAAGDTGVQASDAGMRKNSKRRENPLANVQYGIQNGDTADQVAPEGQTAQQNTEARKSFKELIDGEYKQEAQDYIQNIVQQRFRKNADNEAELESLRSLRNAVGKKFGIESTDIADLLDAVNEDEEAIIEEALARGLPEDTVRQEKKLKRRIADLEAKEAKTAAEMRAREHMASIYRQSEEVRAEYPEFDLFRELKNPDFVRMTGPNSGFNVKQAYEAVHHKELLQNAIRQQAEAFSKSVRANGARPMENGVQGGQAATVVKSDPSTFTKEDLKEIRRRVEGGAKIVL